MFKSKALLALILALGALLSTATPAEAQVDRLRRAAQREAEKQVKRMIGDAIACGLNEPECVEEAKKNGDKVVIVDDDGEIITDENGNPVTDPEQAQARVEKPGEGVWRNYDFTPGAEVWKVTDFSNEPVGRFPGNQLEFVSGNMEIVELDGERVLEVAGRSVFRVHLPAPLPEDFTLEFRQRLAAPNMATMVVFSPMESVARLYEHQYLNLYQRSGIYFEGNPVSQMDGFFSMSQELTPVKFQVDGDYAMMYVGMERVANIPNANFPTHDAIEFRMNGNRNLRAYITDIVVAVGVDDLYDALMETGEFTTRGVFFDVDSDVLRPESTPALEQMRSSLDGHPDLQIVIEGHTDSTGDDAHNQELSERRAAAVRAYLVGEGIEEGRMDAAGLGETEPVGDNETPEGRQQNRRVVLKVRQP